MHAGHIFSSDRLYRTWVSLRQAGARGLTTRQLSRKTGSMAVHSDVQAIRANGYEVTCEYDHTTERGSRSYRYRLLGKRGD